MALNELYPDRDVNKMRKDTKIYKIYHHLQTHKRGITTWQAFEKYRETRLSGRIFELENMYNVPIVRTKVTTKDGTTVTRYTIGEEAK